MSHNHRARWEGVRTALDSPGASVAEQFLSGIVVDGGDPPHEGLSMMDVVDSAAFQGFPP